MLIDSYITPVESGPPGVFVEGPASTAEGAHPADAPGRDATEEVFPAPLDLSKTAGLSPPASKSFADLSPESPTETISDGALAVAAFKATQRCRLCNLTVTHIIRSDEDDEGPEFTCRYCEPANPCRWCKSGAEEDVPADRGLMTVRFDLYSFDHHIHGELIEGTRHSPEDELRRNIDGKEICGFQIIEPNRPRIDVPAWVRKTSKLRLFARMLLTDKRGKRRGFDPRRSVQILWMYYRAMWTVPEIAEELCMSKDAIECQLKRLRKRGDNFFRLRDINKIRGSSDHHQTPYRRGIQINLG